MSNNLLPLLAQKIFNTPMLMLQCDLEAIAIGMSDRFNIDVSSVKAFAQENSYDTSRSYQVTKEGFAVVPVIGGMAHRGGKIDADCMPITSYELIRNDFDEAMANDDVKIIVMEFDSSGGEVSGCFDLSRHIMASRGTKPIIGFVNEACYSAAYAIACCCDEIYLTSTAGLGSIGVVCGRYDVTEFNKKMGLKIEMFVSGDFKADFSQNKPLMAAERERINSMISGLGAEFHGLVSDARGVSEDQVKEMKAGCFTGLQAVNNGLADGVMSQNEFYKYLLNIKETSMFSSKKKETEASYTQAQMTEAVTKAQNELTAEAVNATSLAVTGAVKKYKESTEARLKGIFSACSSVNKPNLAGELMLSDLSLEQAQEKIFAGMSTETDDINNHFTSPEANVESKNHLIEMCQKAADDALIHNQ